MKLSLCKNGFWVSVLLILFSGGVLAQSDKPIDVDKARIAEYWTHERRANAIPRDLVIDPRGLGYLRRQGGMLEPYGHDIAAQAPRAGSTPSPLGKPVGGDTTPPTISGMNPGVGAVIGAAYTFSAMVTDPSGIASVTFKVQKGTARAQSFVASKSEGDTWSIAFSGFTDGDWSWWVVAKDRAKVGNTATTKPVNFKVNTGGGSGTVTNDYWVSGGTVQTAAGRLYFEMPSNARRKTWTGYVCSGTVATDGTSDRSVIITAAHCVYDDANKAFARNVLFIPDQDGTLGTGTDLNCTNDPYGCWIPSFGVVDNNWTIRTFPDNIAWDYAFYVVADSGAHTGPTLSSYALDIVAGSLEVSFAGVYVDDGIGGASSPDFTHALGYSYSDDPNFMYCAEDMTTEGMVNWWLPSCGLSGGSSGGPWLQPISGGDGPIISVNSWGYTNQPGMAGPKLVDTSASCVFEHAKTGDFPATPPADGNAGNVVDCDE